ncbi:flavin reductase [Pseudoroseomonas cervicalis]|nr:flavin reductase [Pseudoroseomonas cervicalis]WBV44130.1 flavin reductase [Pseudoroseomonas cervicalis]
MTMPVSRPEFREAMARLGAAVNVVTSDGPAGLAGLTASAVCSVTDEPATLLVCINRSSSQNATFKANGVLCINVLSAGQAEISNVFAGLTGATTGEERFRSGAWSRLETGAPALDGAAVSLDCVVEEVLEKGTHSVFFAAIRAIRLGEPGPALIWWQRDYHHLALPA